MQNTFKENLQITYRQSFIEIGEVQVQSIPDLNNGIAEWKTKFEVVDFQINAKKLFKTNPELYQKFVSSFFAPGMHSDPNLTNR